MTDSFMIRKYKTGAWKICNNCRGISLLSNVAKIFAQILKWKLNIIAEGFKNES
jgi:ABC-type transporter MlaC component